MHHANSEPDALLDPGDVAYFSTNHAGTGAALVGLVVNLEVIDL